jgi:cobyrinic acid a,c-diamide synthase
MKEKLRNLFDEMKVRSRYKSMNAIIDMIEPLINQEVEKRIAERMPSEEEINKQAEQAAQRDTKDGRIGIIIDSTYYGVFCDALEWLRSRLTCSEKPNNSQKTEGEENG